MKTKIMIALLGSMVHMVCMGQTPEEVAGQKMLDSIMQNMPKDQRAMMQQMMQMGKDADAKRKLDKEKSRKQQTAKNKASKKRNEMEFYWRNTIATNTQGKFENWPYGEAVVRAKFYNRATKKFMDMELGSVSAEGQVTVALPKLDFSEWPRIPITKPSSEGDHMLSNADLLEFSNTNATYLSTRFNLGIYRDGEQLGHLKMGNSIKPVVNLNAPCCFDKAGDGYTAYWVYMSQANTINGNKDGVKHDLSFQAGWNLVTVKVEGVKEKPSNGIPGPNYWKNQYYTATTTLPEDAKYYFTSNQ